MKKALSKVYWIIRVFVITVVFIIIFSNLVDIENENLQKVIGAILMIPAYWIDTLIFKDDESKMA